MTTTETTPTEVLAPVPDTLEPPPADPAEVAAEIHARQPDAEGAAPSMVNPFAAAAEQPPEPTTTVPVRAPSTAPQHKRRLGGVRREDRWNLVGAAAAALALSALLFGRLTPMSGTFGFIVVTYVLFLAAYAALVSLSDDGPAVRDRIAAVVLTTAAVILFFTLIVIVGFTLWRGHKALFHTNFFTQDMAKAGPLDPLTVGGIKHALVGTLEMITIALVITVPLGVSAAVYLNEMRGRFPRFVRTIVEAMTALPSIVAGLFIYATWILILGNEKSALAAALAISVMMLPIIIRASDVVLRLVPGNLKEASAALGAPRWRTVWHVVLPTSRSGLATAVILGTARGIGETSPVLLTAGYTAALNTNPVNGPMVSLPLATFEFVKSGQPNLIARGFATAAFLLLVVLALFVLGRVLGGRAPGDLSRRQALRAARRSRADLHRMSRPAETAEPTDTTPAPSTGGS